MRLIHILMLAGILVGCSDGSLLSQSKDTRTEIDDVEGADIGREAGEVNAVGLLGDSGYCVSKGDSTEHEFIESVNFTGRIVTGDNKGYLAPRLMPKFDLGKESISLHAGYPKGGKHYAEYWRVWIDFNQNKVFDDNELVFSKDKDPSVVLGRINVPVSAKAGETMMRVSMRYGAGAPACGNFSNGEVEDYRIELPKSIELKSVRLDGGKLAVAYGINFSGCVQLINRDGRTLQKNLEALCQNLSSDLANSGISSANISAKQIDAAGIDASVGDRVKICDIKDTRLCSSFVTICDAKKCPGVFNTNR